MSSPATIARPYAQAVFDLAREEGSALRWSEMLEWLSELVAVPDMAGLIASPTADRAALLGLIGELGGERLDQQGRNLARLLADNRRLPLLPRIAERYEALRADDERRAAAQVITARALSPEQRDALAAALEASLGRNVRLDCQVDERLLGGALIRVGDRVIDGTAAGRLRQLAQQIV